MFGGTFDPPHVGHLVTAVNVRHALALDRRPAGGGQPAVAEGGHAGVSRPPSSASRSCRRRWRASPASRPAAWRSTAAATPTPPTPWPTLQKDSPDAVLFVVLGSDAAAGLDTWERYEEVRDLATIVVVDRPGAHRRSPPTGSAG